MFSFIWSRHHTPPVQFAPFFALTTSRVRIPLSARIKSIAERLEGWQRAGDDRLWRLIVSPEFGDRADLRRLTRELVSRMERDLGTPLEWVAVAHHNTELPQLISPCAVSTPKDGRLVSRICPGKVRTDLGFRRSDPEILFAFNNLYLRNQQWSDEDWKIADIVSSYWANFAANGNPTGKGSPSGGPSIRNPPR